MHRLLAIPFALLLPLPSIAADEKKVAVFDPLTVWEVHLALPAKEYDAMQPPAGWPTPPKKPEDGREVHKNVFGVDLPWAKGSVTVGGKTFEGVGIRYKGNGTLLDAARTVKKSFKVDLDQFGGTDKFHGLKTLNLHCGVTDPSKLRETLAYQIYRDAGVPAPKTALAVVTLTVAGGKYADERLGLYTLVQPVDKAFLKEHFKTDAGLLLKPEKMQGLDHLGEDWARYIPTYEPKRDATPAEQKRLIAFTRLVNQADDKAFATEIGDYLDVDGFWRFQAATSIVANTDSFFTLGHNYCLYLHPETNRFHFIPWDVDRALANFPVFGSAQQQMDLSVVKPYAGSKLADRLMAMPGAAEKYLAVAQDVQKKGFDKDHVLKSLATLEGVVKEHIEKDAKAAAARKEPAAVPFGGVAPPDLKTFVEKRAASVQAQLGGKSKGYTPLAFAPGGAFGRPGGGFGPGNQLAGPLVQRLDADKDGKVSEGEFEAGMKKLFAEWDVDKTGGVDQKELADGLQKLLPAPPAFGPGR